MSSSSAMIPALKFVAMGCGSMFAGSALYVSAVSHPAALRCGEQLYSTYFGSFFWDVAKVRSGLNISKGTSKAKCPTQS